MSCRITRHEILHAEYIDCFTELEKKELDRSVVATKSLNCWNVITLGPPCGAYTRSQLERGNVQLRNMSDGLCLFTGRHGKVILRARRTATLCLTLEWRLRTVFLNASFASLGGIIEISRG